MDKLMVVIRYGGDFTRQMDDKWHWSGDSMKTIMVDKGILFEELLDKICKKLNLDRHTDIFEIKHDYLHNMIVTVSDEEDWEITKLLARSSVDLQLYLIFSPREEIIRIEASPGRKKKSKKFMTRGKGKKLMDKVSFTYQLDGCVIGGSSAQDDVDEEIVASNPTLCTMEEVEPLRCSPPYSQWFPHDNEGHNVRYDCRNFDSGDDYGGVDVNGEHRNVDNECGDVGDDVDGDVGSDVGGGGGYGDVGGGGYGEAPSHDEFYEPPSHEGFDNADSVERNYSQGRSDESGWIVGQRFANRKALKDALHNTVVAKKWEISSYKTDPNRRIDVCKTPGCPWRLYATKEPKCPEFVIRTYTNVHTCRIANRGVGHRDG